MGEKRVLKKTLNGIPLSERTEKDPRKRGCLNMKLKNIPENVWEDRNAWRLRGIYTYKVNNNNNY